MRNAAQRNADSETPFGLRQFDDFQRKTADLGTIIDVGGYDVRGQQMAKHIDGYM